MFGWDFENSKSDRIKLFLFILVIFLVIGFSTTYVLRSIGSEEADTVNQSEETPEETEAFVSSDEVESEASLEDETNKYNQTEHFTEEQLAESKEAAVEFVHAYHPYNAEEPTEYLETAKPHITDSLYGSLKEDGRREVLERSILTVNDTQVTEVVNPSSIVVRWNVMVTGEAQSIDGSKTDTEDWYLVGLREREGEWLVEDVRINVPN
ncbi:hypothetical protein [Jeotgalibacillus proteolyticus]|uniref:Tim44-like domain-containing protein n=1 Tax=Jeotgalibacillus proteolyticus TaxID=2082395 RepID=A0A2S5G6T4_9BACL|nr:hypothetical protein [Jeotgalibacillus proteolyticus]PPA68692.1 hypothetical protein C4B60_19165 [Jeotgalibacillus proteolyticus]PPA68769.1 hypothetical protein C4B60_19595 [Jeotgalibacillus proteolyticus]